MIVDIISFGFKTNSIPDTNYLIDVRFLKNPFYIDKLRDLTGLDSEVIKFFENDEITKTFINMLLNWIEYIIKANKDANKEKFTIAIGCTGGQHRSPYIVEILAKELVKKKIINGLSIYHRELKKYNELEI